MGFESDGCYFVGTKHLAHQARISQKLQQQEKPSELIELSWISAESGNEM